MPFFFVMLGGVLAGLVITKVGPNIGSAASQAATTVTQLLYHFAPHLG
jgi:hypothetical protein